jgi:tryptophan synthase beta subunit
MFCVATATMAAKFGFECTIYMGEVDVERRVGVLVDLDASGL